MTDTLPVPQEERLALPAFVPWPLATTRNALASIALGVTLTIGGSLLLALLARQFFPASPQPDFPAQGGYALFMLVVFAPFLETLIMAGVLRLLTRFLRPAPAILASAIGWGLAHSAMAPTWGLVIWWPFLIFSTLYLVWRQRGFWAGVGVAATTHALQNLGPALLIAFQ